MVELGKMRSPFEPDDEAKEKKMPEFTGEMKNPFEGMKNPWEKSKSEPEAKPEEPKKES